MAGQRPPEGSLAEAFWEAQADLPFLPEQFDDPELGRFAKAMYRFLVPPGAGIAEVSTSEISSKVNGLRKTGFTRLALGRSPRHLNKLFRKLLAVTVKFCSQLTGEVAAELVRDYLHHYPALAGGPTALSDDERSLLDFRYGACHDLGNINVGFFYGNGFLVGLLLNKLYMHYALASPETEREKAAADLHVFMHLLRKYRGRRKLARAQERRANRQRSPRARRPGQREAAEQPDRRAKNPGKLADQREKLEFVRDRVLPHLRPHDRRRLEAMLAADGVRAEAAKSLGITLTTFSRQWRQTTSPNIQRVIRELKFDDSE
ncbi:MAG TPA: hypothetical protein VNZ26_16875 [Vicinamibacterales bacterium]|nr:hypothetical protein [Vicinamibacterales bacterium]